MNISSAHGKVASPNKSAYVAGKHGLVGLSKVSGTSPSSGTVQHTVVHTCSWAELNVHVQEYVVVKGLI